MMRISGCILLVSLAALETGCGHAPGYPPNPVIRPSDVTDFATLYRENCAACHGANGQGGPAIDLANPEYQALIDDATLRKWISNGMPGTEMAAFAQSAGGMLTDAQVNALIAGMRRAWLPPDASTDATLPPYAEDATGNSVHGQQVFNAYCVSCHQSPHQDITSADYLALVSDQALRSIIIAGRPDIGQPDLNHLTSGGKPAAPFSARDVTDVVAYLASLRAQASAVIAANSVPPQSVPAAPIRRGKP
jgi:cytochrome c oxidase cbb3-type subunit III